MTTMSINSYTVKDVRDAIIFGENIGPNTLYPIESSKKNKYTLLEILGKIIESLELTTSRELKNDKQYDEFLSKMKKSGINGLPYRQDIRLAASTDKDTVMQSIENTIMINNGDLLKRCQAAMDVAYENVQTKGLFKTFSKANGFDEFICFQVTQDGHCLEIIPAYFEFQALAKCETNLFKATKMCQARMIYKHVKFIFNSGHIKTILDELDDDTFIDISKFKKICKI